MANVLSFFITDFFSVFLKIYVPGFSYPFSSVVFVAWADNGLGTIFLPPPPNSASTRCGFFLLDIQSIIFHTTPEDM